MPSKEFFFKVQVLAKKPTYYELRIELYRGEKLLVTSDARAGKGCPALHPRPTKWGGGQLVFLLEVQ